MTNKERFCRCLFLFANAAFIFIVVISFLYLSSYKKNKAQFNEAANTDRNLAKANEIVIVKFRQGSQEGTVMARLSKLFNYYLSKCPNWLKKTALRIIQILFICGGFWAAFGYPRYWSQKDYIIIYYILRLLICIIMSIVILVIVYNHYYKNNKKHLINKTPSTIEKQSNKESNTNKNLSKTNEIIIEELTQDRQKNSSVLAYTVDFLRFGDICISPIGK